MLGNLGTTEIIIIAVIIFLFFGGKKLPELARGIAKASEEFSNGLKSDKKDTKPADQKETESQSNPPDKQ